MNRRHFVTGSLSAAALGVFGVSALTSGVSRGSWSGGPANMQNLPRRRRHETVGLLCLEHECPRDLNWGQTNRGTARNVKVFGPGHALCGVGFDWLFVTKQAREDIQRRGELGERWWDEVILCRMMPGGKIRYMATRGSDE